MAGLQGPRFEILSAAVKQFLPSKGWPTVPKWPEAMLLSPTLARLEALRGAQSPEIELGLSSCLESLLQHLQLLPVGFALLPLLQPPPGSGLRDEWLQTLPPLAHPIQRT